MKSVKIALAQSFAVIAFVMFSVNAMAATFDKTSALDDYKITAVEEINAGSNYVWNLEYSNSRTGINITKVEHKSETEYIVRGEFLEVRYISNKKGFGARAIKNSQAQLPYEITSNVINTKSLSQQAIISPNKVNDETALSLIASYLPELVNNNYKHILQ